MSSSIIIGLLMLASLVGQLIQVPLFGIEIAILDLALGAALILGGVWGWRTGKLKIALKQPIVKYLLWFIATVGLSLISATVFLSLSVSEVFISGLYTARLIAYLSLFPILISVHKLSSTQESRAILSWSCFIMAALGLAQLALFPNFQIYDHFGWDPHSHRLIGSFLDPNFTSVWLAFFSSLGLAGLLGNKPRFNWVTLLSGALFIVSAGAIILTVSRSGLIALAVGLAVVAAVYLRRWVLIFPIVIILGVMLTPSLNSRLAGVVSLDTTVRFRLESWEGAVNLIKQHPVLGVGYNTLKFTRYKNSLPGTSKLVSRFEDGIIRPAQLTSRADAGFDSSLLTILATTGILGLASFMWWVWNMITSSLSHLIMSKKNIYSVWFLAATASLFFASWFINAWLYPPILVLWLIIGSLAFWEQQND